MNFHRTEHRFSKHLKTEISQTSEETLIVGCSGGLDSMALLEMLVKVSPLFSYKLKVLHVHHGNDVNSHKDQSHYRDRALALCEKKAEEEGIEFEVIQSDSFLKTEQEARDFRLNIFKNKIKEGRVFLAHHKDDLFETVLIRLIRGTHLQGLKNPFSQDFIRPFLNLFSKKELRDYQKDGGFEYLEDPSNRVDDYLRNWLRNQWLPELEKSPYGLEPFKKSLTSIVSDLSHTETQKSLKTTLTSLNYVENKSPDVPSQGGSFTWSEFLSCSQVQKKVVISQILHHIKKSGYTSGQVYEILKNLERNQARLDFKVSGVRWQKKEDSVEFLYLEERS